MPLLYRCRSAKRYHRHQKVSLTFVNEGRVESSAAAHVRGARGCVRDDLGSRRASLPG